VAFLCPTPGSLAPRCLSLSIAVQMMQDYNQLHYGARYRDLLVAMLRRRQEWESKRAQEEKEREAKRLVEERNRRAAEQAAALAEAAGSMVSCRIDPLAWTPRVSRARVRV
jgi:hypothetical protein